MGEAIGTADILVVERLGEIERVTLNRPDRLNALNQPLTEALLAYFEGLRRNRETRVVILRGAGRAFCAGADLKAAATPEALRDGPNGDWTLRDMQKAMRACPQPIIALVRGAAAGGGLTIALAADIVVASESAAFHPAFLAIGLSGAELGVSWRLQRAIGVSRAREMLLAGRPLHAEAALAAGLVSAVTARGGPRRLWRGARRRYAEGPPGRSAPDKTHARRGSGEPEPRGRLRTRRTGPDADDRAARFSARSRLSPAADRPRCASDGPPAGGCQSAWLTRGRGPGVDRTLAAPRRRPCRWS